ncbi:MAG TPA: lipid-binding SYLF domain-containing protein [Stellaceae bacterium]|nr:lipid-binding SYLF domain-containing protein [Stellaceae bacterium]
MSARNILMLAFAAALFASPAARAASDQQQAVDSARLSVEAIASSQDSIAQEAHKLMAGSRGVIIIPELVKGGFFFGAQGGTGVLLARDKDGQWSNPAFYLMGAGSFGLQIGVEVSKVVLIIMNDKALHAVMRNEFKLGAEAGVALATLGAGAEASTTTHAGADIYAFAISKGLFGGVAIEGGVMKPRAEWDKAYYGRAVSVPDIILRHAVDNPGAVRLRSTLAGL